MFLVDLFSAMSGQLVGGCLERKKEGRAEEERERFMRSEGGFQKL